MNLITNYNFRDKVLTLARKIYNYNIVKKFILYIFKIIHMFTFFVFNKKIYHYFLHSYNNTYLNERAIEIPIIWEIAKKYNPDKILEVGNVLSNYFYTKHKIVDKYEEVPGVINEDIANFDTPDRYDLIISISTLEHIGESEVPKEPRRILAAIENLKNLLAPEGQLIFTLPLGENKELDEMLDNKEISFSDVYYMKRISPLNFWKQVGYNDIYGAKYNEILWHANGLVVGIIKNEP